MLALTSLTIAVIGYLKGKLNVLWRTIFAILTLIMLTPQPILNIVGIVVFTVLIVGRAFGARKQFVLKKLYFRKKV